VRQEATGTRGGATRTAQTQALLSKAVSTGLTAPEASYLNGELSRLAASIARVNARAGRQVVEMSPYAKVARDAGASAVMTV
jgi:hypothetical protein